MNEIIRNCIIANYENYKKFFNKQTTDFSDEYIKYSSKFYSYEKLYLKYICGCSSIN